MPRGKMAILLGAACAGPALVSRPLDVGAPSSGQARSKTFQAASQKKTKGGAPKLGEVLNVEI